MTCFDDSFVQLVLSMRNVQKQFAQTQARYFLIQSRHIEKLVDQELLRLERESKGRDKS